jgi:hypothetical protein
MFTSSESDHCFIFTVMLYVPDVFAIVIFIEIVCEYVFRSVASKLFKFAVSLRKCSFHHNSSKQAFLGLGLVTGMNDLLIISTDLHFNFEY